MYGYDKSIISFVKFFKKILQSTFLLPFFALYCIITMYNCI
nr:MAG TPA: hypothetical protein [Caudoviricetes sp.]